MHRAINAPGHGNNLVYGINAIDKHYLREKNWNLWVNYQVTTHQRLE